MSEDYLEVKDRDCHNTTMKMHSTLNWTARFLLISNKRFLLVFLFSYIFLALFLNHVYFVNYMDVEYGGTIELFKMEPVYHFVLRHFDLIEGGEFKDFDTDLSRLWDIQFLYAFASLYVLEWIIFRIFSLLYMPRKRTS